MDIKEEEEFKKEFQLERVVLFTDAVFAIILTIMVLEIKLPEGMRHAAEDQVREAFKEVLLKFLAYVISFGLVARFWATHLRIFKFLKDYDSNLVKLNLVFLFCVSLFPFAISLISGNISQKLPEYAWGWTVYTIVVYSSFLTQALLCRYLLKHKETLCLRSAQMETDFKWKIQQLNMVLLPIVIGCTVIFSYFGVPNNYMIIPVVIYGVTIGRLSKKWYPKKDNGPLLAKLFKAIKKKPVPPKLES
ncbi:DUF1211 domain-containing protein [Inquilinus sp. KBS0705]|nr:DUF1211 domain-containing protein [Inquilinus sp. KBS0705]